MANIKLTLPAEPFSKQIVTFTAPCGCDQVTDGLVINGETYTVCDAMGECVTGKGGAWCAGAQISVVLDCENKKAFIQNAASPNLKDALNAHIDNQNNPHNVTADQVQVTENVVNAFEQTGNWSVDGILAQIGSTLFGGDVLYRWQKAKSTLNEEEYGDIYTQVTGSYHIRYSSKIVVNADNTITLVDSTDRQIYDLVNFTIPEGMYFIPSHTDTASVVYKAKSDSVATIKTVVNKYYQSITNVSKVTGTANIELVTSEDPNAHYDGEVDAEGYTYTALDPITAFVPRIQTGSYVGTGTSGASNPNSLTLSFEPKMVVIQAEGTKHRTIWFVGASTLQYRLDSGSGWIGTVEATDNSLQWYATSAQHQMNTSGQVYDFIAIG